MTLLRTIFLFFSILLFTLSVTRFIKIWNERDSVENEILFLKTESNSLNEFINLKYISKHSSAKKDYTTDFSLSGTANFKVHSKSIINQLSSLEAETPAEELLELNRKIKNLVLKLDSEKLHYTRQIQAMFYLLLTVALIVPFLVVLYRHVKTIKNYILKPYSSIKKQIEESEKEKEEINIELIKQIEKNEKLHFKVARELEGCVRIRTEEITAQNEEIISQRDELERQKTIISQKNKDLLDSMKYARRIQDAILVGRTETLKHFKEAFILYKPKDIISGDFYWYGNVQGISIFAIADCTGHGVPGAVLTMLGNTLLNQIILKDGITEPSEILEKLDTGLNKSFRKASIKSHISDGMDIALVTIDLESSTLLFSGAKNPLYYAKNGIMNISSPIPRSIGSKQSDKAFVTRELKIEKGYTYYLFSDGYYDQFGGSEGRKFMKSKFRNLLSEICDHPASLQKDILKTELEKWQGDREQTDDIIVAGFKLL